MFKNVASQKLAVYAYDTGNNAAKTGDAANITMQISKDGGATAASNDVNPTELDSSDAPGVYLFDLTQAETNCDLFVGSPVSATSDIILDPMIIYTVPPNFTALGIESDGDVTKVNTLDGHTAQTGDNFARLGAPAGASVSADVAAVKADTAAILIDTADMQPKLGSPAGADMSTDIAAIKTDTGNIETDTQDLQTQIGTAGAGLTDLGGMSTGMKAEVNAEVVDTLNTDTYAEPGQESPGATVALTTKIGYLYKAWRNKSTQTATEYNLYADDASTVDQKSTVSDDGTTATMSEKATGP